MTLDRLSIKLKQLVRRPGASFRLPALCLWAVTASASGLGPGGVNLGFDFNWNNGVAGATASFIAAPSGGGASLNNCGGPVTPSTTSCDFVFAYSVGGVAQPGAAAGGVYQTWTLPANSNSSGCDQNPSNSAPLTMFNCFNQNSFGQVFMASTSGALTSFSMNMTCLNPAGTPLTGVFAAIYQINPGGNSIPGTPLGTAPLNLAICPTLTNWTGHTFTVADFAVIPINFTNVTLASGTFYGVYFGGVAPGVPLPGSPTVTSVTPNSGPPNGGNTVTITGTGFTGATSVTFGGAAAPSFSVVNDTTITATVPAGQSGAASVVVTTPNGSNSPNTLYSYALPTPTLSQWGMISLSVLLILLAWFKLREDAQRVTT